LSDLFVGRRRPATDRNVDVAETERFGLLALGLDFVAPAAKIDDGGDTELLEFGEAVVRRLRAAKEKVVYFARIRNSGECDFCATALRIAGTFGKAAEDCAGVVEGAITGKRKITM
jgi:hypothetical protein